MTRTYSILVPLVVPLAMAGSCGCAQNFSETVLSTGRPTVGTSPYETAAQETIAESGLGAMLSRSVFSVDGAEAFVPRGLGSGTEMRLLLPNRQRTAPSSGTLWQNFATGTHIGLPAVSSWHFATGPGLSIPTGSVLKWTASKALTPFIEFAPALSSVRGNSSYTAQGRATWLVHLHVQSDV